MAYPSTRPRRSSRIPSLAIDDALEPERALLLGMSSRQRLLLVVHVEVDESTIRIISARRATSHERRRYEEEGH
jgi:uncharacterized DUF497 family protein